MKLIIYIKVYSCLLVSYRLDANYFLSRSYISEKSLNMLL